MARPENEGGSFLILEDGNLDAFEAGNAIRHWLRFGRYGFDMSKFSIRVTTSRWHRERYLWNCSRQPASDPIYHRLPDNLGELATTDSCAIYPLHICALTLPFSARRAQHVKAKLFDRGLYLARFRAADGGSSLCSVLAVKSPFAPLVRTDAAAGSERAFDHRRGMS